MLIRGASRTSINTWRGRMRRGSILSSTMLASLCKASVRAIVSHALWFQLIREISRQLLIPLALIHSNVMKTTLRCKYYGTLEATEHFLPLMKNKGRVVNVASMSGRLNKFSDTIRDQFLASKTVPDITKLIGTIPIRRRCGEGKRAGLAQCWLCYLQSRSYWHDKSHCNSWEGERQKGFNQFLLSRICKDRYDQGWWIKNTRSKSTGTGYTCVGRSQQS